MVSIHTSKGANSIGHSRGGCTFQRTPYFPRACNLDFIPEFDENYYEHWVIHQGKQGRKGMALDSPLLFFFPPSPPLMLMVLMVFSILLVL